MQRMVESNGRAGGETANTATGAGDQVTANLHGGPEELVVGRDFADAMQNESYNAEGVIRTADEPEEIGISPTVSASTNAGANDLPPIREGKPLLTPTLPEPPSEHTNMQVRPRFDHSFSTPAGADTVTMRDIEDGELDPGQAMPERPDQLNHSHVTTALQRKGSNDEHIGNSSYPQQKLSLARQQLLEEAQHGEGLLAVQSSAVDANDSEDEDAEKPPHSLGGITSYPASKHVKTSSMPFLPSQGFDVLVAAPSQKGAEQLNTEAMERKRARADSQNRSAMDQTRHPGLSGARPAPRGRTAGGPAAGIGIRKASAQSNRRASTNIDDDGRAAGYFDDDMPLHELAHLDRQDSTRYRRGSQQSHTAEDEVHAKHVEARPVGGRSSSHRSSNGRDTKSAWLSRNMPSHVSHHNTGGESVDRQKRTSLQQDGHQDVRKNESGPQEENRHSEETAFSFSSAREEEDVEGRDRHTDQLEGAGEEVSEQDYKGFEEGEDELWLGGQGTLADGSIAFPTTWSRWRYHSREFLAELVATMLLITVGTAVDCQVVLSQSMGPSAGGYPNQNWAWGIAVASTIYLSGGRSGAHCNPAITLALAVFRGFPWIQVPVYWSAQLLGSILGAAVTYGIYLPAIDSFEGGRNIRTLSGEHGTGRLFVTVPQLVFTASSGFGTEVVATSILMAMVLAVGDETNAPPSDGLSALVLGFVVVMIGMSFGWPTSYAISPSRDLGPRLFLYMVGYGKELWTHNSYWWIYGPQCGCFVGGLMGALLYDMAIFTGEESPINYTKQGWKQSTPARVGSRLMNSAERVGFWTGSWRRGRRGCNGDGEDHASIQSDEGAANRNDARSELSRSEDDALGSQHTFGGLTHEDSIGEGRDSSLHTSMTPGRKRSHASQELDAQEEGRS